MAESPHRAPPRKCDARLKLSRNSVGVQILSFTLPGGFKNASYYVAMFGLYSQVRPVLPGIGETGPTEPTRDSSQFRLYI
eukprot:918650-Amphidinium_carterae.1